VAGSSLIVYRGLLIVISRAGQAVSEADYRNAVAMKCTRTPFALICTLPGSLPVHGLCFQTARSSLIRCPWSVPMNVRSPIACRLVAISLAALSPLVVADTVLITGANSGIGFELARQYAAEEWTVIATHRRDSIPDSLARLSAEFDNVRVETIDVTDMATISAVADKLDGMPIDILINNAGIVGELRDPAQQFGQLDYEQYERYMDVNMAGPLRMSEAFYDHVAASNQKKIVAISSISGSIGSRLSINPGRNGPPPRFWYDTSKAALNMSFVALATIARDDGIAVAVYMPGLVLVERTRKYGLPENVYTPVETSAANLRARFAELSMESSGSFLNHTGELLPW
jgi:NAD(P)-dependent dehydrogenase (short-subunit alcohol dehydrogenase family)